jgi:hypothetical protein
VCDFCKSKVRGMRWKCAFCYNYDLCKDCKPKSQNIHDHPNNHAFKPIAYPTGMLLSNILNCSIKLYKL